MEAGGITRYAEVGGEGLLHTEKKIQQFEKFREDYESLKDLLLELPDRVSYSVMVPLGSMAFMPGKLVHTNEIQVLLGENWFAERSAKEAAEVVSRHTEFVNQQISDLKKQEDLLRSRLDFALDAKTQAESGIFEIREDYDEEKEKKWREQHKLNVKKHYKEMQEAKKAGIKREDAVEKLLDWEMLEKKENEIQMEVQDVMTLDRIGEIQVENQEEIQDGTTQLEPRTLEDTDEIQGENKKNARDATHRGSLSEIATASCLTSAVPPKSDDSKLMRKPGSTTTKADLSSRLVRVAAENACYGFISTEISRKPPKETSSVSSGDPFHTDLKYSTENASPGLAGKSRDISEKQNSVKTVRWQDIADKKEQEEEGEGEVSSDDSEEYVELCRPRTIHFRHTPSTEPVHKTGFAQDSGSDSSMAKNILSPADICPLPVFAAPKSILKKYPPSSKEDGRREETDVGRDLTSGAMQRVKPIPQQQGASADTPSPSTSSSSTVPRASNVIGEIKVIEKNVEKSQSRAPSQLGGTKVAEKDVDSSRVQSQMSASAGTGQTRVAEKNFDNNPKVQAHCQASAPTCTAADSKTETKRVSKFKAARMKQTST